MSRPSHSDLHCIVAVALLPCVLQDVFKTWTPQNSYSIQLASLVLEQQQTKESEGQGPFGAGLSAQREMGVESAPFWMAVQRAGHLGAINLVANERDEVSSRVFTPAESLIHQVRMS